MLEKKEDRRIRKTKKAIRTALSMLLVNHDIEEITVTDLSNKADISRKTFYNSYNGIYEVMEEIENEIVDSFILDLQDADLENALKNPYPIFQRLKNIYDSEPELYKNIFLSHSKTRFISRIEYTLKAKVMDYYNKKGKNNIDFALTIEYCISGTFALFQYWFINQPDITLAEPSTKATSLTAKCISSM